MKGEITAAKPWSEMVDLFFYRDPEDIEKEQAKADESFQAPEWTGNEHQSTENWNDASWNNAEVPGFETTNANWSTPDTAGAGWDS